MNLVFKIKGKLLATYLLLHGCKVGGGLKCKQFPIFRYPPHKNMELGKNVNVGFRITFDPTPKGKIILGDNVNLTQDIVISSHYRVKIGNYTQIAEFVSIRDSDHNIQKSELIVLQGHNGIEIEIGEDVWIGAGTRVLKGSKIPEGVVIGCNSLVTAKSILKPHGIYVGSPVRLIRLRND
ncbi:acyltransferase [Desulfosarcina cetonica]|uniref:acyltransferase n=1 Tax=Desulfosarcina cetonica TaxID=90730 RepID=UPI00155DD224|nr:acyltransferase [Desulfosarcina cetonica]